MNNTKLLTVITPTYNCASYISRSYSLLISQSYSNWEWVVVDDGSLDETPAIFQKLISMDSRVKYFKLEKNMGRGFARSVAIQKSTSDVIIIWDIDDIYCRDRIKDIFYGIVEKKFDYFYSDALVIDSDMQIVGATHCASVNFAHIPVFRHPSLAFHKRILRDCEYSTNMKAGEDLSLMLILQNKYRGYHSKRYHLLYLQDREINLSKTLTMNLAHLKSYIYLFRKNIIKRKIFASVFFKYILRHILLLLLKLWPDLYMISVRFRSKQLPSLIQFEQQILAAVLNVTDSEKTPD